jgi:hypothetical protein
VKSIAITLSTGTIKNPRESKLKAVKRGGRVCSNTASSATRLNSESEDDKHVAEKRDHTLVGLSIADRLASVASRLPGGGAGQTNECGRVIARGVGSDERADRRHEEGESVSLRARWANHYSARFGRTHLDERGGG